MCVLVCMCFVLPATTVTWVVTLMFPWAGTGHFLLTRRGPLATGGGFRRGCVVDTAGRASRLREVQQGSCNL